MSTVNFKYYLDFLENLFRTAPELQDNTGTNTKINIIREYPEKLIEEFPIMMFLRGSIGVSVVTPRKYEDTYNLTVRVYDVIEHDKELLFERLDNIVRNVLDILKRTIAIDSQTTMSVTGASPNFDTFGEYPVLGWDFEIAIKHKNTFVC